MFGENVRNTLEGEVYLGRTMLGRMLETRVGGRGILGMMLRGRTMFGGGEC